MKQSEQAMKIIESTKRILGDALMHYVCMRLRFRSSVLNDSPPKQEAVICEPECCPAEG